MPQAFDADEIGDAVARRADFLASVAEGPKHNRDLQDELDVSRSTAYKALRELDELSLVERGESGFVLTLAGRLLLDEHQRYRSNLEDVCAAGSLLTVLPADDTVSAEMLHGADVVFAQRHAPNKPVGVIEDAVREADSLYGLSPVLLPVYVEVFHDCIVNGSLDADLLLEAPVVEHLGERYEDELNEVLETGQLSLWETDETLPFGLLVTEEPIRQVLLIVYDAGGELRGLIVNDTAEAAEWGRRVWTTYRSGGRKVEAQAV